MLKFQRFICKKSVVFCNCVKFNYILRYNSKLTGVNSSGDDKSDSKSPVADFYAGKSVFITGGTGFLGKVFIEKLLYTCDDLDKIYMLIREKKGVNINDRMEEMFRNPLFTRLKNDKSEYMKKVIPVAGDLTLPNLGIKPEDEMALIDKVSVVIHSAATVMFNEPLPEAMNINYEGTVKLHNLCKRMHNINVFVYISTAYSQTDVKTLEEIVYPPPADISDVYKFMERYGYNQKETMKFLDGRPNTYTFTKALTESYIAENHGDVPAIIIRPSGVTAIKDEPLKGWLDNWYGPTRVLYNVGKGWDRVTLGKGSNVIDLIPVDYVCNLTIVAAAKCNQSKVTEVYNCCTSSENPITFSDLYRYMIEESCMSGQNEIPYPFNIHSQSRAVVKILIIILQIPHAYIADLSLRIRGKDGKYVKLQSRVINIRNSMDYFSLHSWVMKSAKALELTSTLSHADKLQFPCDPKTIRWDEYMRDYCHGIYKYLVPK